MAKINSIDNKSSELSIDPGASGDSFIQFAINTTGEFRIGVDDDASDSFKISQGSALGTNDTFIMSDTGERTMPLQPCFLAHINSDISNVTGDGTVYTAVWDSEEFDQGGDFDGTSTFTAPVTGKYHFVAQINPTGMTSSNNQGYIEIAATGDTYRGNILEISNAMYSNTYILMINALIPMTAADTAVLKVMVDGSTKTVGIQGNTGAGSQNTFFSCNLVC